MKATITVFVTLLTGISALAAGYKVDQQIGKGNLGRITQLSIGQDDSVCALEKNGKITLFKSDGSMSGSFSTGMNNTTALAIADTGSLYVFSTLTETRKVKSGARMREVQVPIGVECGIFNAAGEKLRNKAFDNLKSAQAVRIVDNKLIVADLSARALVFMDLETGNETHRIKKGLRLCCGIFDFCTAPDNTVAVSNLGAFKLQRYDLNGKLVSEFGQRGRELDDFQGCCNPVSAAYLPGGKILTVEKSPTRIKIYDAGGQNAKQIEGVEELVKGCSFIPSAVDSKGNLYLAAPTKGYIVKCVQ